jgi:tRNA(Arg) A34 adenosine deaminase TadA
MIILMDNPIRALSSGGWFQVAQQESTKSDAANFKLGSIVLKKRRIVSKGFNNHKSDPKLVKYGYKSKLHAEFSAMMRGTGDMLFVARFKKDGQMACAKPCIHCLHTAKILGIDTIVYSDWDGNFRSIEL